MIPVIGHWALIMALLFIISYFINVTVRFFFQGRFNPRTIMRNRNVCLVIFILCLISFLSLIYSHITDDFSVINVYLNSHSLKPLLFKVAGVWGSHEGSMLLVVLILSIYNMAFSYLADINKRQKDIVVLSQIVILFGFICFVVFTSNPFTTVYPAPEDGMDLNPILQDVGLAIHPPILYFGYIGMSLALSFAIAALVMGDVNREFIKDLKRWLVPSLAFLTMGIVMGSWWAYRELGWGGFWFWDPVENASVMPWLTGCALLHSILVTEKRKTLKRWTMLLAIITFSLSLLGIFLVRSGVLTSVHAFANDPARGIYILAFILIVTGSALILFALRASSIKSDNYVLVLSREGGILINNMLMAVAAGIVVLGTLYPLILEVVSGDKISVGSPYFNSTFNVVVMPLLFLCIIVPSMKWKKDKDIRVPYPEILIAIISAIVVYNFDKNVPVLVLCSIVMGSSIIVAMLRLLIKKLRRSVSPAMSFYAMIVAHIGFGILAIAIAVVSNWQVEQDVIISKKSSFKLNDYDITLDDVKYSHGMNYLTQIGSISVKKNGDLIALLKPERRFYPVKNITTIEADIYYSLFSNVYAVIGESDSGDRYAVRVYYKPGINLVWLGGILMAAGMAIGLIRSRRL